MRFWKTLTIFLVCVLLLAGTVAPALAAPRAAEKIQVQFQNKTGEAVRITLSGPATVTLNLGIGKTKAELEAGTYKYSYTACGKTNTGTFKVRSNGDTLTLAKCAAGGSGSNSKIARLVFQNQTGATLYFNFSGPQHYSFAIPAGKTRVEVVPGKYTYTVSGSGCGAYFTDDGKITIKGDTNWRWYCN